MAYSLRFLQRVYLPRQVGAFLPFLSPCTHRGVDSLASMTTIILLASGLSFVF